MRPAPAPRDWLATRTPDLTQIVNAVRRHVEAMGDAHLEATRDAVIVKRARTFAEVKARRDRTELSFIVSRRVADPPVVRTLGLTRTAMVHVIEMIAAGHLDQHVRDWLTEAQVSSPT